MKQKEPDITLIFRTKDGFEKKEVMAYQAPMPHILRRPGPMPAVTAVVIENTPVFDAKEDIREFQLVHFNQEGWDRHIVGYYKER